MNPQAFRQYHDNWTSFINILNHEFVKQTGTEIYTLLSPLEVHYVYQQCLSYESIHQFISNYVNDYISRN